ncbi:hydrolase or acyltransferase [Pseudomonas sp. BAY1663]|uniref:alpha/beta hydrolase family protein n=1 Tax=Pseudomonas sp. BAY1663 TaxID=1439940 RepID=UPI00042E10D5|nr:alpha/beta hydrolase family protein [Pseudomonas sp. BAY1663]EXF46883.1 hydrolase or acyltransferase [Pseudomonas sp. BAY1663]
MTLKMLVGALALLVPLGTWAEENATPTEPETPPAAPVALRPALAERSTLEAEELARLLPQQAVRLQAGDERFVALHLPANDGQPKGLVILLPDTGENADWPSAIGPLRRRLPDAGWHTLSLSLPDADEPLFSRTSAAEAAPESAPPADSEADDATKNRPDDPPSEAGYLPAETAPPLDEESEPAAEPEPATAAPSQAERIRARIDSALAFARQQNAATIVLLGHGSGAYWAARYLQQQAPADVRHLLLVQVRTPADQEPSLERLLGELRLATGDFYFEDRDATRAAARERLNTSRRLRHPDYSQVALQVLPADRASEQEQLYRRIRGWLTRHP